MSAPTRTEMTNEQRETEAAKKQREELLAICHYVADTAREEVPYWLAQKAREAIRKAAK